MLKIFSIDGVFFGHLKSVTYNDVNQSRTNYTQNPYMMPGGDLRWHVFATA